MPWLSFSERDIGTGSGCLSASPGTPVLPFCGSRFPRVSPGTVPPLHSLLWAAFFLFLSCGSCDVV